MQIICTINRETDASDILVLLTNKSKERYLAFLHGKLLKKSWQLIIFLHFQILKITFSEPDSLQKHFGIKKQLDVHLKPCSCRRQYHFINIFVFWD